MEERDLAYVAGIIDARAHFAMNDRHGRQQPRLSITTRRILLLDHFAKLTGAKVVLDDRGYERRPCGSHCTDRHSHVVRQSARVTIDSARATIVLYNVQPFIVAQVAEVRRALLHGLEAFPPARGDTATQMRQLGWEIPSTTMAPADHG